MFKGQQLYQLQSQQTKITAKGWAMLSRRAHKNIQAMMEQRYEKAQRAVCGSLITSCRKKMLRPKEISQ